MSPHAASPQAAMRSYAQLCGIATALDVIGDRWTLLVVRDLLLGPLRFSDLAEGLPGIGTNTLTTRLKALEVTGVVHRQLLPLPERGTVYELTTYGRELEPILLALGRWGTRSMGTLPPDVTTRSRWLVAAMLAFHDDTQQVPLLTTWELRLTDGAFTVRAKDTKLTVSAGRARAGRPRPHRRGRPAAPAADPAGQPHRGGRVRRHHGRGRPDSTCATGRAVPVPHPQLTFALSDPQLTLWTLPHQTRRRSGVSESTKGLAARVRRRRCRSERGR